MSADVLRAMALRVWDPTGEDEPEEPNAEGDLERAAERYAEKVFYRGDYPMQQEIHVRDDGGQLHVFDVETTTVPVFTAARRKA